MMCFVRDLHSLSPPLLGDIKQLKIAYILRGDFNLRDFHHLSPICLMMSCCQNITVLEMCLLMDAANKCVLVEFVLLEQKLSHLCDLPEAINKFYKQISAHSEHSSSGWQESGSEAVIPTLNVHQLVTSSAAKEIQDSVWTSLPKRLAGSKEVLRTSLYN